MNLSFTEEWTNMWSGATHVCPQLRYLPKTMRLAAKGISAVLSTMHGLLPPSSSVTGISLSAARRITSFPTAVLPVKKILSNGMSSSAEFSALPPSTVVTYSGANTSAMSAAISLPVSGEYAEGLTITVFPAAIASTSGSIVSMNG